MQQAIKGLGRRMDRAVESPAQCKAFTDKDFISDTLIGRVAVEVQQIEYKEHTCQRVPAHRHRQPDRHTKSEPGGDARASDLQGKLAEPEPRECQRGRLEEDKGDGTATRDAPSIEARRQDSNTREAKFPRPRKGESAADTTRRKTKGGSDGARETTNAYKLVKALYGKNQREGRGSATYRKRQTQEISGLACPSGKAGIRGAKYRFPRS